MELCADAVPREDRHSPISHYGESSSDLTPEQFRAIGWVAGHLHSLIFEVGEDNEGEYYHLVTLWRSTKEEQTLYEKDR